MRTSLLLPLAAAAVSVLGACGPNGPGEVAEETGAPTLSLSPVMTSPTPAPVATTDRAGPETSIEQGATVEITVEDGQVVGGIQRIEVPSAAAVELTVRSDVADTVHVHGYDIETPVAPGEPASLHFTADIPGVFEVELEDRGLKLADLEVGG